MADLVKDLTETVFDNYTTTLGEAQDKVVVGNEKVVFAELSVDDKVVEYIEPTIRFTKWSEEESLTLSYPTPTGMTDKTLIDGEGLKLYGGAEDFYFNRYDDNTFKFGLILNEVPDKSKIVTIDGVEYYQWQFKLVGWEEFDFFYQPPLKNVNEDGSTWEIDLKLGRSDRPVDITGSYAVYHKTKKDHINGKTNYQTGKFGNFLSIVWKDNFGEIYRQNLFIDNGIYYVRIKKEWADKAAYPIKANDTFGKTTSTGTAAQGGYCIGTNATSGVEGTLDKISFYHYVNESASTYIGWVYLTSDASLIAYSIPTLASNADWRDYDMNNETISASTDYMLGISLNTFSDGAYYRYDSGGTMWYGGQSYAIIPENPWTGYSTTTRIVAVYATYTPSAGGAVPIYTKEILSSLPATAANLSTEFTEQEYTDVLTDDGNYVDLQ